ncbi:MAG: hypothetical protein ACRC62_15450 [Microcoleus sp.]
MRRLNPGNLEAVKTARAVVPPRSKEAGIPNLPYSSVDLTHLKTNPKSAP